MLDRNETSPADLIATVRSLDVEIGDAEADVAHFEFDASMHDLLGTELDIEANGVALAEARRRLGRLRDTHAAEPKHAGGWAGCATRMRRR